MKEQDTTATGPDAALTRLVEREEVLEICYWYKGEGLGEKLTPAAVLPFMTSDPRLVAEVFDLLVDDGDFAAENGAYDFTPAGKKKIASPNSSSAATASARPAAVMVTRSAIMSIITAMVRLPATAHPSGMTTS